MQEATDYSDYCMWITDTVKRCVDSKGGSPVIPLPLSFLFLSPLLLSLPLFSFINNSHLLAISNITGDNRCSSFLSFLFHLVSFFSFSLSLKVLSFLFYCWVFPFPKHLSWTPVSGFTFRFWFKRALQCLNNCKERIKGIRSRASCCIFWRQNPYSVRPDNRRILCLTYPSFPY